jgi:hypothetical protein
MFRLEPSFYADPRIIEELISCRRIDTPCCCGPWWLLYLSKCSFIVETLRTYLEILV